MVREDFNKHQELKAAFLLLMAKNTPTNPNPTAAEIIPHSSFLSPRLS
jgi:hypothetical protein